MFDNGAFSTFTGKSTQKNAPTLDEYYLWLSKVLVAPHWAVVPDVIDGGESQNDTLAKTWPFSRAHAGVVWHMDESLERLRNLAEDWPRVCIGSTKMYGRPSSKSALKRLDEVFRFLERYGYTKSRWIHGFRMMMALSGRYPFASVDSADLAINHHVIGKNVLSIANRWDCVNGSS